ncbi:MAG: GntR family transcriptional regulator [Bacteroidota bacterium]|nr:GntR family transcriptional regulator [Bacteroidota bacterium]
MFIDNTPIFIQLSERLADDIIEDKIKEEDRIPSVRELAGHYEVNINTAMKAIERLASNKIIYNKRGMGYYVSPGAKQAVMEIRKKDFFDNFLPFLSKTMKQLSLTIEDIKDRI